ncbi:MAG: methylenetetrahydrofolate reductase, partial [Chitinophagaceae bacterium]|nr:methylenetetrahydrofolate reductase [Chitinophagaceae bacterium]
FIPDAKGHKYASGLLQQVKNLNSGYYLHGETKGTNTQFCIGIAGYPEKHFEAPNREMDIKYLKEKVDLGAEYIVTQMFFDNAVYLDYVKKCREAGISIPIIPGLKPITSLKQITVLPRSFHISIPDILVRELLKCKTDSSVKQLGTEWCIQQSKDLLKIGVPCLHYYTMSKPESVIEIASALF